MAVPAAEVDRDSMKACPYLGTGFFLPEQRRVPVLVKDGRGGTFMQISQVVAREFKLEQ